MKKSNDRAPFSGYDKKINKRLFKASLIAIVFALFALPSVFWSKLGDFGVKTAKNAYAAETRVKNLEYFELDKPIAVQKSGNSFYIAQSDLIVIYHDETYDKIDLKTSSPKIENVTDIKKCGTRLLILADDGLFAMNLTTFEIKKLFSDVSAVSVCENANDNACAFITLGKSGNVSLYKVTDATNFVYSSLDKNYISPNAPQGIALCPDYSFYYYCENDGYIYKNGADKTSRGVTRPSGAATNLQYSGGTLYYKSANKVYSVSQRFEIADVADLSSFLANPRGFALSGNLLYACDYDNDKVVEYDVTTHAVTGFEISFTKIYLPSDFSVNFSSEITTVTIKANSDLYSVDLHASIKNGFFSYVESYKQPAEREYLIVCEVEGGYYLVAGDCFALIDKNKGYSRKTLSQSASSANAYAVSAADALKLPVHDALIASPESISAFKTFAALKNQKLTVLSEFAFGDYEYALVQNENGQKGYLPSTLLTPTVYVPEQKTEFYSANAYHKKVEVYSDETLSTKIGEIEPYSQIMIYGEGQNSYSIKTKSGLKGYIAKNCVQNPSYYCVRTSIILIVAGISFLITALFLENKYLYAKKN